jgi:hypothetical protein
MRAYNRLIIPIHTSNEYAVFAVNTIGTLSDEFEDVETRASGGFSEIVKRKSIDSTMRRRTLAGRNHLRHRRHNRRFGCRSIRVNFSSKSVSSSYVGGRSFIFTVREHAKKCGAAGLLISTTHTSIPEIPV